MRFEVWRVGRIQGKQMGIYEVKETLNLCEKVSRSSREKLEVDGNSPLSVPSPRPFTSTNTIEKTAFRPSSSLAVFRASWNGRINAARSSSDRFRTR